MPFTLSTPTLTPEAFVQRWQNASLSERASYQQHFADVCRLVGAPTPAEFDTTGEEYTFEYGLKKTDGRQGYADVFLRGHFAIEYKQQGKYKDLSDAYRQLQQYRENLNNPPLLVVCDIDTWEIHTNFTNAPTVKHTLKHADLTKVHGRNLLRRMFADPASFHPEKNKEDITKEVAAQFKDVVDDTLEWQNDPERVARFMTRLVFCMFVEDIGLLPKRAYDGILTEIIRMTRGRPDFRDTFPRYIGELFTAMARGGNVQMLDIPYFNGSLFDDSAADIVPMGRYALSALDGATDRDWSHVEPTIFGTIFERTLDQKKRGQLGAHYTSPDDIRLILEPVLMQPLRREWEAAKLEAAPLRERWLAATTTADRMAAASALLTARERALYPVRAIRVLDPACGSGNFLYMSLRLLLDLEKEIIKHPLWAGFLEDDLKVNPTQLYGIEINEIAHALASVVVWIGYLQWRYENGYYTFSQPILRDMRENIRHMDAILAHDAAGKPTEPEWPTVDVIVGNPPFLGGNRIRAELGDKYVDTLFRFYEGRIGATADLVAYWFERARAQIEAGKAKRAGLLATNSIRGGVNREVLNRIKESGDIFMAWSDNPWVLEGAAVRVSIVGFDGNEETTRTLDGKTVSTINADLTGISVDITKAIQLPENTGIQFEGTKKGAEFEISDTVASNMLRTERNKEVVKPWLNGEDFTGVSRKMWIIDFGADRALADAQTYAEPFAYVKENVMPKYEATRRKWWLHERPRPEMRLALAPLSRYIATVRHAKYRLFIWLQSETLPDSALIAIARDDDYFFGVLHSKLHEVWSLRMGTWLGKGNDPRYTPTTTFETFPFPFPPGKEDMSDPRVQAVAAAAKALHEERHAWLHPGDLAADLKERTLTNLYNALAAWRGSALTPQPPLPHDAAHTLFGAAVENVSGARGSQSDPQVADVGETSEVGDATPAPLAPVADIASPVSEASPRRVGEGLGVRAIWAEGKRLKPAAVAFAPRLAVLHDALDRAVCAAYGWDAAILADEEAMLRALLALNAARAGA